MAVLGLKVLSALGLYRRVVLLRTAIGNSSPAARTKIAVSRLDESDLPALVRLRGATRAALEDRLRRGDLCFGGRIPGGELACVVWCATAEARLPYVGTRFPVPDGHVYVYDVFTRPASRGLGAARVVTAHAHAHFGDRGRSTALAAAMPDNESSLRYLTSLGYRPFSRLGYVRVGPWRRRFGGVEGATADQAGRVDVAAKRADRPGFALRGLSALYARLPGAEALYRRLAPIGHALRRPRLTVSRLEGPARLPEDEGSILFADPDPRARGHPLLADFFREAPGAERLGRVRPGRLVGGRTARAAPPCDLAFVRLDRVRARRLARRGYLACPEWVGTRAPVPDDIRSHWRGVTNQSLGSDLRRIEREGLEFEICRDPGSFASFYYDCHLPFVRERHGVEGIPRTEPVLRRAHRRGGILWIVRDGVRSLGVVFSVTGGTLELLSAGATRERRSVIRQGAMAAVYRYGFELASDLGCTAVDFGGTRPSLLHGLTRYKRKWGCELVEKPDSYHDVLVRWDGFSPRLADFLSRVPLVFREGGGFSAVTSLAADETCSEAALEETWSGLEMRGVRRLYVLSADAAGPVADVDPEARLVAGAPPALLGGTLSTPDPGGSAGTPRP